MRRAVRHAVLLLGLHRRHVVVAPEHQLAIDDVVDRIAAPIQRVFRPAARTPAAAPFVGEDDLRPVVVERRRVPVGDVLVDDLVEPDRIHRIPDVHEDAVPGAGAGGQAELREDGDVVTLGGRSATTCVPGPLIAALPEPRHVAGFRVGEDARAVDDARRRGCCQRHLDDVDAEQRGVRIFLGIERRAARQLFPGSDGADAGPVDVDVALVLRIGRPACAYAIPDRSAPPPPAVDC